MNDNNKSRKQFIRLTKQRMDEAIHKFLSNIGTLNESIENDMNEASQVGIDMEFDDKKAHQAWYEWSKSQDHVSFSEEWIEGAAWQFNQMKAENARLKSQLAEARAEIERLKKQISKDPISQYLNEGDGTYKP